MPRTVQSTPTRPGGESSDLWGASLDADGYPREQEPCDDEDGDLYGPTPSDLAELAAIEITRESLGTATSTDDVLPDEARTRFASLDWEAAYQTDFSVVDWLPGRFMERGQQVTLVGDGKVGKSLFALDWAFRCAAGRSFLGDTRREPLRVLYVDRENSLRDIVTRAQGLGAKPRDLVNLIYKPFPQFNGTLDQSRQAASELVSLAELHGANIVIIDTVSRFIGGKENDSDTWLQLYQMVHARLKHAEIACLRLDHFGKDAERGSRGSSAKSQDVDAVWELTAMRSEKSGTDVETITTNLRLSRTHTRTGLGEDLFPIVRKGERSRGGMWLAGRTRHEVTDGGVVAQAKQEIDSTVQALIDGGCPPGGRDALKAWMKSHGMPTPGNQTLSDIARELKARGA